MKIFGNPGTFDPRSFKTFGVNVKHNSGAIGKFGTGLKYAIACMVRMEKQIYIIDHNGEKYEFTSAPMNFRGKEFQQILCNGQEMPFTTEYGKYWEEWQIYRELASNCLDENGVIGKPGDVTVYADLNIEHDDVFLSGVDLVEKNKFCEVYSDPKDFIYYRGIRTQEINGAKYSYNILDADLTEDRTFKYGFDVHNRICNLVCKSQNKKFIESIVLDSEKIWEGKLDFDWATDHPSNEYLDVCRNAQISGKWRNKSAIQHALKYDKEKRCIIEIKPNKEQKRMLKKALKILKEIGYDINYSVCLTRYIGENVLGHADKINQTIWITDICVAGGLRETISCLLEEYIHLHFGVHDYTRQMQDILFNEIITQGIKCRGIIL